jgi:catechol 2,3-dioxygenase-like lactoylglutathione lyase family enzyme
MRNLIYLILAATPAMAQLAAHNSTGVAMGHIHLMVKDPEVHKQLWLSLGGTVVKNAQLELIQIPGAFIMLRKGDPAGGSGGSRLDHFGIVVKSYADTVAKLKPMTTAVQQVSPTQAIVTITDDIRIELMEDQTQAMPAKMHHVHWWLSATLEAQAWYAKLTGAVPAKRGAFDTANMPGVELAYTKNDTTLVPTKGRSFDHVGFDVKSLDEFAKRLEAQGVKFDAPFRQIPNAKTRVAFFTDPWGAYVEITENLAP